MRQSGGQRFYDRRVVNHIVDLYIEAVRSIPVTRGFFFKNKLTTRSASVDRRCVCSKPCVGGIERVSRSIVAIRGFRLDHALRREHVHIREGSLLEESLRSTVFLALPRSVPFRRARNSLRT